MADRDDRDSAGAQPAALGADGGPDLAVEYDVFRLLACPADLRPELSRRWRGFSVGAA
jgi:hypothetical protein